MIGGSWQNGHGNQHPVLMTNMAGTFQYGVSVRLVDRHLTMFKRNLATNAYIYYELSGNATALADGITPLTDFDVHRGGAVGVDNQDRVHLLGNMIHGKPHYLRSAAGDITTWTSIPWPWTNFSPTDQLCTYNVFERLSDGRLIYFLSQRSDAVDLRGDIYWGMILPNGADIWQPLVGTDGHFAAADMVPPAGEAERVYVYHVIVEPRSGVDRVHVWGNFIYTVSDNTSIKDYWYIYTDNIDNPAAWKRLDGTTQNFPIKSNNTVGTAAIIGSQPTYSANPSPMFDIDSSGYPHCLLQEGETGVRRHCWWNGTTWLSEIANTGSVYPSVFHHRNGVLMYRNFGDRIYVTSIMAGGPAFRIGGTVDDPAGNWLCPLPDPIQLRNGVFSLMIPDGNTPLVYDFGGHARRIAS